TGIVAGDEQLDAAAAVLKGGETGIDHPALQHHAAGHADRYRLRFQHFIVETAKLGMQRIGAGVRLEVIGEGCGTTRAGGFTDRFQFFATFRHHMVFVDDCRILLLAHRYTPCFRLSDMNGSRSPSSTLWVLPTSRLVRRSLIRDWSST